MAVVVVVVDAGAFMAGTAVVVAAAGVMSMAVVDSCAGAGSVGSTTAVVSGSDDIVFSERSLLVGEGGEGEQTRDKRSNGVKCEKLAPKDKTFTSLIS